MTLGASGESAIHTSSHTNAFKFLVFGYLMQNIFTPCQYIEKY